MAFPRVILVGTVALFTVIGIAGTVKKVFFSPKAEKTVAVVPAVPSPTPSPIPLQAPSKVSVAQAPTPASKTEPPPLALKPTPAAAQPAQQEGKLPKVDRIQQLFTTGPTKLPIVETISYSSQVPWLKGRPAWVGDYASYYSTSRHFIARGLNGKPDYVTQKISPGSKFNVFRKDRNFQFHLLVDVQQRQMGFYYIDLDTNERVLLKTYDVGLGKPGETASGTLTPLGKYLLGDKIAVYKPGITGLFHEQPVEMIRVFGTRWIPFGKEIGSCTAPAKGYGIHGAPWVTDKKTGKWTELRQTIGQYDSDGCIRLAYPDMEELFSIVVTKPTVIEIVKNSKDAKLPGVEVTSPMR